MSKKKNTTPAEPQKKLSLLNAAAAVLAKSDEPLNCKQMIAEATAAHLWTPGSGKTPELTLYSAIKREMKTKGERSRFKDSPMRGHFAFSDHS